MSTIRPGMTVRTPLGTGVVREVGGNGRLKVLIRERIVVIHADSVTPTEQAGTSARRKRRDATAAAPHVAAAPDVAGGPPLRRAAEVDLHGLIVTDAMARVLAALDAAMRAGHDRLRIVHGRGSGRIRAALHRQLREVAAVQAFRLDPTNDGVTIVEL